MNSNKKLIIISNEKVSTSKEKIYCDNIDMKSIPAGLSKNYEVLMISRKSNIKRFHQINIEKIKLASNIFTFLLLIWWYEPKYMLLEMDSRIKVGNIPLYGLTLRESMFWARTLYRSTGVMMEIESIPVRNPDT